MRPGFLAVVAGVMVVAGCARSPMGHPQLRLVDDGEMARMGLAAFEEVSAETPVTKDEAVTRYVQCVGAAVVREAAPGIPWEIRVFESADVNAFALPGGKIGVYTGILEVTENQDQLAAILAHEVAHVTAHHGNARVSAALATETGLQVTSALVGTSSPEKRQLFGLLGVGAQVGVLLPYGRDQETEADLLGLDTMARAGFDPRGAVALWQRMQAVSDKQPPTFLSTHPSHEGRIEELNAKMTPALERFTAARQAGKAPRCPPSGPAPTAASAANR